jgi:hypothetical protein
MARILVTCGDSSFVLGRRWFQFRLRTLLIGVPIVGAALAYFTRRFEEARWERIAVQAILREGGDVTWEGEYPSPRELAQNGRNFSLWDRWRFQALGVEYLTDAAIAHLDRTGFSPLEFAALERLGSLRELTCDPSRLPIGVAKRLCASPKLRWMQFEQERHIPIQPELFAHCPELQFVLLTRADVTADVAQEIAHLDAFQSLSLHDGDISAEALRILAAAGMTSLSFDDVPLTRAHGLALGQFKNLKRFGLRHDHSKTTSGTCPVRDDELAFIAEFENLESLSLTGNAIRGPMLAYLKGAHSLSRLNLNYNPIDDDGLRHLPELPSLKELLLGNTLVTDASIDVIVKLPLVDRVDLEGTQVTGSGVRRLFDEIPTLRRVWWSGYTWMRHEVNDLRE